MGRFDTDISFLESVDRDPTLYQKHPTVSTLAELHQTKCGSLPCQPGIYRVLVPEKLPISFIEGSDNLRAKGYPAAILEQKYGQCTDKTVLYIGKANGRGGLRQRVLQYVKYGCGHRCQPQGRARHLAGEGLSAPAVRVRSLRKLRAEGA
ncbi:MAG: hypothetical protein ACLUNQ_08040 [Oscillospiraceae bacterium]